MKSARRLTLVLLIIHLFVCIAYYLFITQQKPPIWTGMITAFFVVMVQFTWSFTVGMLVGPSRPRRRWYALTLLLAFMPLKLVFPIAYLLWRFVGISASIGFLLIALGILVFETVIGVWYGLMCRASCTDT